MPPTRVRNNSGLIGQEVTSLDGSSYVPYQNYNASTYEESSVFWFGKDGHYGYPDFPKNSNVGGPMRITSVTRKRDLVNVGTIWTGRSGISHNLRYTGSFVPDYLADPSIGEDSPAAWAAEAYRRMRPDRPSMDLAQAIGELKDLPMMLKTRFTKHLRDIGNYYLALKFGWEPLLRDIVKLYHLQQEVEKRIKQLLRDNGKPVRRRIKLFSDVIETSKQVTTSYSVWYPVLNTYYYRRQPYSTICSTYTDEVWASAQFRYWLPSGPRDLKWRSSLKRELMGTTPSPSTIYNLVPWSWLVDWFTNAGDVIDNLTVSVAERCAADYFYMMRTVSRTQNRQAHLHVRDETGKPVEFTGHSESKRFAKHRLKGDPFGLATNQNTLTGMQWSILGALGLSRL